MRRTRRALVGPPALLLTLLTLAACSTPLPSPAPQPPAAVAPPVLTVAQTTSVLTDLGGVLAAGDAALDVTLLAPRVVGPALAMRSAEYLRSAATAGERQPTALPTGAQVSVVPQSTTWPRVQLVVTEQPEDLQVPRLLVLEQATPRDRYALWGWARMFPGVSMPPTADPVDGSPVLDPADAQLAMAPDAVLSSYADLLTSGAAAASAASFAPDPFRDQLAQAFQTLTTNVQEIGTVAETYTPDGPPLTVIGTADGGALVVGSMTTVSAFTITVPGSTLKLQGFDAAASGVQDATASVVWTYTDVLVFRVPPAGSSDLVQLIAAEHQATAVGAQ